MEQDKRSSAPSTGTPVQNVIHRLREDVHVRRRLAPENTPADLSVARMRRGAAGGKAAKSLRFSMIGPGGASRGFGIASFCYLRDGADMV